MIKPLTPIPLPRRGFASGMPYSESSAEYTHECLNMLPFDSFEDKLRVATRQGLTTLINNFSIIGGSSGDAVVQFLQYYKVYDAVGDLKHGLVAIVNGKLYYTTSLTGHTGWTAMLRRNAVDDTTISTQLEYHYNTDGSFDNSIQGVQVGGFIFLACSKFQTGTTAFGSATTSSPPHPSYLKIKLASGTSNVPVYQEWLPDSGNLPGCSSSSDNIPDASEGATLISSIGSRVVLSGQPSNPTNWYMSGIASGSGLALLLVTFGI